MSIWGNSFLKTPCTSCLATLSWIGSSFLLCFQTVLWTTKTSRSFSLLWELLIALYQFPLWQKKAKYPLKEQYYGKALCTNHCSFKREKFPKTQSPSSTPVPMYVGANSAVYAHANMKTLQSTSSLQAILQAWKKKKKNSNLPLLNSKVQHHTIFLHELWLHLHQNCWRRKPRGSFLCFFRNSPVTA